MQSISLFIALLVVALFVSSEVSATTANRKVNKRFSNRLRARGPDNGGELGKLSYAVLASLPDLTKSPGSPMDVLSLP